MTTLEKMCRDAEKQMNFRRQLMQLREIRAMREVRNGRQKNL
jgi:hypothetical protein